MNTVPISTFLKAAVVASYLLSKTSGVFESSIISVPIVVIAAAGVVNPLGAEDAAQKTVQIAAGIFLDHGIHGITLRDA